MPEEVEETKEVKAEASYKPWEMAREFGEFSFKLEAEKVRDIDKSFGTIMTYISISVAGLGFAVKTIKLDFENNLVFLICSVLFLILFSIIILSILGQYHRKQEFIRSAGEIRDFLELNSAEYSTEDNANYYFIDQLDKIHKSQRKILDYRLNILRICHILMIIAVALIIIISLFILKK
ncbi:MAG: hypothetical protein LBI13_06450 [Streptococcaceae bacterium]|jgi:hypothetical protein|nr:hypothetical protein [Streptococcaceae bacterium]